MINRNYTYVTTICFAISLAFYSLLSDFIALKLAGIKWAAPIISGMTTIGFYLTLFSALMWAYNKYIEDLCFRREAIKGDWFYKLLINNREYPERYGKCVIEKTSKGLFLSGVHFDPVIKKFTSHFFSEFVEIQNSKLKIGYKAVGIDDKLDTTEGMFFLQSVGTPPKQIHGFWSDILPIKNSGSITLIRYDENTKKLMEHVGYPNGSSESESIFNITHLPNNANSADAKNRAAD